MDRSLHVGVDVGGTFTDLVIVSGGGRVTVIKAPTNVGDPSQGVLHALELGAQKLQLELSALLDNVDCFVHGTTIATNTLLERKGAKVGLLCTAGFRDTLEIRRGYRENMWDHRTPWPAPLVPRSLRLPVGERTRSGGAIERKPEESEILEQCDTLVSKGCNAIAVAFMNSVVDPGNENICRDIISNAFPELWVSVSSEVCPHLGEYERTSSTVLNCYVGPRVVPYLKRLAGDLERLGLKCPLLLVQSNGGVVTVDQIERFPNRLLLSGPAAGVAALKYHAQELVLPNLLSMEIGGTSCDIALISDGKASETTELNIEGYPLLTPSVDIHTAAIGGGTIAGVDAGGTLFVGPAAAGANPGPACFGLGGEQPTITDAQLALGRLRPGRYAGGVLNMDPDKARAAIQNKIANPLGVNMEQAAHGIIKMAVQDIVHAMEAVTVNKGLNPSDFVLISAGGAGSLHASSVARHLGIRKVIVPRFAGVMCAFGMCTTDVRIDLGQPIESPLDDDSAKAIRLAFDDLEIQANSRIRSEGLNFKSIHPKKTADIRYSGQQHSLLVDMTDIDVIPEEIEKQFTRQYSDTFGYNIPNGAIRVRSINLSLLGEITEFDALESGGVQEKNRSPRYPDGSQRQVYLNGTEKWRSIAVHNFDHPPVGVTLQGPCILEASTTTIFLQSGDRLTVLPTLDLKLDIHQPGDSDDL